ncbi:MAG: hypothetical protein RBS76_01125 [Acholeplasmatales bacterium]|jgi:hypothetical protein|nr:hypothetical protein [Acholeplasmataceae bacterium]MDY0115081.1 hypothetical protein [Acholeplasmatales bacterium]MCK9233912.1 hypothetical protein [Acholeplasmataceae bacterium]MCK9289167.1 hypothetical protein [Acholeplasmataceae bacterium]MCK9427069.1 hypothetical protein [Acholeplasmataceae bacterium]
MAWHDETYIIGEKVQVKNEKEMGVVTRIDQERDLVFVQFKRMREESYPYPEAFEQGYLVMKINK